MDFLFSGENCYGDIKKQGPTTHFTVVSTGAQCSMANCGSKTLYLISYQLSCGAGSDTVLTLKIQQNKGKIVSLQKEEKSAISSVDGCVFMTKWKRKESDMLRIF